MTATAALIGDHRLADGSRIETVELRNDRGLTARILAYGATLIALEAPDRDGVIDDVVLGHDEISRYVEQRRYFGSTIGRYANRIAHGRFTLAERLYALDCNDGANHLHGGIDGFDRTLWAIGEMAGGDTATATLHLLSSDGDQGYPGALSATATYTISDDALRIDYRATTTAPTIVNMTSHSVFNLAGSKSRCSAMDHRLTIHAQSFTPVDEDMIPTGDRSRVAETPFDFREATSIGSRIRDGNPQIRHGRGYDHNYIVDGEANTLRMAARLEDPTSGRVLELLQTAPGLQFYAGNQLDGSVVGKTGRFYRQGDGIALEPQAFPDSPNHPDFPSAVLMPGEVYRTTIVYRLSASAKVIL